MKYSNENDSIYNIDLKTTVKNNDNNIYNKNKYNENDVQYQNYNNFTSHRFTDNVAEIFYSNAYDPSKDKNVFNEIRPEKRKVYTNQYNQKILLNESYDNKNNNKEVNSVKYNNYLNKENSPKRSTSNHDNIYTKNNKNEEQEKNETIPLYNEPENKSNLNNNKNIPNNYVDTNKMFYSTENNAYNHGNTIKEPNKKKKVTFYTPTNDIENQLKNLNLNEKKNELVKTYEEIENEKRKLYNDFVNNKKNNNAYDVNYWTQEYDKLNTLEKLNNYTTKRYNTSVDIKKYSIKIYSINLRFNYFITIMYKK